jgi:hypothetical protein
MTAEAKTRAKKRFDCVEMKREAQRRISRELSGKSLEGELEFWHKAGERLNARIARNKRSSAAVR